MEKFLEITSISDLQKYSSGNVVELPAFGVNQRFVAKLRRPSMLALMKNGKIPNMLLHKATQLFENSEQLLADDSSMQEVYDILEIICEATFVEPSYKEIKEAGIQLTDDQLMFIFNYSQQGVNAIAPIYNQ